MGIESPVHLIFIAAVALIVLGPKRLPRLARALGQGIREFRGAIEQGGSPSAELAQPAASAEPSSVAASPAPAQAVTSPPQPDVAQPEVTQPKVAQAHAAVADESADHPPPSGPGGSA
jgi:sec-independent protein translocase protein TatA